MNDAKLSEHFWLSEFTRSETAERHGIDNTPPAAVLERLERLAEWLEVVRRMLGHAVHVLSGFRCEALERVLTRVDFRAWCARHGHPADDRFWPLYFGRKAHPDGRAVDFACPGYGSPLAICRAIAASEIPFDQLIYEHTWVHLGFVRAGDLPRRQVLTQIPGGGYASGIVEKRVA
jgi:hypothetical protein